MSDTKSPQGSWIPTNPLYDPDKPMQIGGQAVIEGVMMRAPGSVATAVRRANGEIVVQRLAHRSLADRYPLMGKPFIRGAFGLVDMMYVGLKTLNFSAEVAMEDEELQKTTSGQSSQEKKRSAPTQWALIGSLVFALGAGIALFFATPLAVTTWLFDVEQDALTFNLVSGAIRMSMFLTYLGGISLMKDIRRLFEYHGAEHKAVFAFELRDELLPPAVALQSRFHPRCGTSFLLIVMVVAIISFAFLDLLLLRWFDTLTLPIRLGTHLPFIPVVGGISYEVIRFSARHASAWWGRALVAPGLWLQTLTTREPDQSQIEVAIIALRCALGTEDAAKYPWNRGVEQQKDA